MTAVTTRPRFLTNTDFATTLTARGRMPTVRSTPDEVALWRLATRWLWVDTEAGSIFRQDAQTRAETPLPNGYGHVYLGRISGKVRYSPANRVVWLAAFGPIPGSYIVAHRNGLHWDNRVENLVLSTRNAPSDDVTRYVHSDDSLLGADDRPTIKPYTTAKTLVLQPTRMNRRNVP